MATLHQTEKSIEDLNNIIQHLVEHAPSSVHVFIKKMKSRLNSLCSFPQSGTPWKWQNETLRKLTLRQFRILVIYKYMDDQDKVVVIRVVHGAKDLSDIIDIEDI
jgi:plasmid stabilization system protein ParE